jgi:tetratricopeptide (TPR) repeat protein
VHLLILIALSLTLYALTMRNGFVTDDNMQILQNPFVTNPEDVTQAFRGDVWSFAHKNAPTSRWGSNYYRPLQILMYTGEYAFFGKEPRAWHLVNMLLNATAVALVYLLLSQLSELQIAFFAALCFALHPMHTEVAAWIAAMPELLCAIFLLCALIFYHRSRSGKQPVWSLLLSSIFFVCALLSKETALLFPLVLVAYEYLYCGVPLRELRRVALWILPSLGILTAYAFLRIAVLGGFAPYSEAQRGQLTPWELFLAIPPVVVRYIGKLLVPVGMNYFYFFPLTANLGWASLSSMAVLACLAAAVLLLRARQPLLAFSLAWFLLTLAPALSLNSIGDNFFTERYLYIPSLGFCVIAAWAGVWLFRNLRTNAAKALLAGILATLLLFCLVQIERRIPVFHDNFSLYSVTVLQSPNSSVVHDRLASAYFERGDLDRAVEHGFKAVALNPEHELARINLAGYLSDKGRYPEAVEQLRAAIQLYPQFLPPWINLAKVFTLQRDWKSARECYLHIAQLDPDQSTYFRNLAVVTEAAERTDATLAALRKRAGQNPRDVGALVHLGDAYAQAALWKDAQAVFQRASQLTPQDFDILTKLAVCFERTGDFTAAISVFERAITLRPDSLSTQKSLASALAAVGSIPESNAQLQHILQKNPRWEHADQVHLELGLNFEKTGERAAAQNQYQQALELNPNLPLAQKRLAELSPASGQTNPDRTSR